MFFLLHFFLLHTLPSWDKAFFSEQVVCPLVLQHCKMYCHNWHSLNKALLVAAANRQKAEWTTGVQTPREGLSWPAFRNTKWGFIGEIISFHSVKKKKEKKESHYWVSDSFHWYLAYFRTALKNKDRPFSRTCFMQKKKKKLESL